MTNLSTRAARVAKTKPTADETAAFIDEAYKSLEKIPGFRSCPGQRALSRAIFDALTSGKPLAAV